VLARRRAEARAVGVVGGSSVERVISLGRGDGWGVCIVARLVDLGVDLVIGFEKSGGEKVELLGLLDLREGLMTTSSLGFCSVVSPSAGV